MGTVTRASVADWAFQGTRGEGHLVGLRAKPRHAHEFVRWVSLGLPHELAERERARARHWDGELTPARQPPELAAKNQPQTNQWDTGRSSLVHCIFFFKFTYLFFKSSLHAAWGWHSTGLTSRAVPSPDPSCSMSLLQLTEQGERNSERVGCCSEASGL